MTPINNRFLTATAYIVNSTLPEIPTSGVSSRLPRKSVVWLLRLGAPTLCWCKRTPQINLLWVGTNGVGVKCRNKWGRGTNGVEQRTNGVGVKCRSKTQHCRKGETFYSGTLLRPHLFKRNIAAKARRFTPALYSDPICPTPFVLRSFLIQLLYG